MAYQVRAYRDTDPDNPVLLPRRRIVQYLGVNAYELVTGSDLSFESNTRFFADFGLPRGESALIDGAHTADANFLYAHLNYRHKGLHLRLGRQLYGDMMDVISFDGLTARYMWKVGIGVEAYGGLWVKGSQFLGSNVYAPDGVRENDDRRIGLGAPDANAQLGKPEPVFGAKLLFSGIKGFGGSIGYRRSMTAGKVDLERTAAQITYGRGLGFNALLGADYDLYATRLAQLRAQLRYDWAVFAITAEAMRLSPTLSSDSIWYYFSAAPRDEARLRGDLTPLGPFRYYLQLVTSKYHTQLNDVGGLQAFAKDPNLPSSSTVGGAAGTAARFGPVHTALDATYRTGVGARQLWIDLTAGFAPNRGRYSIDARFSLANVRDTYNPLLRGAYYGVQLWASYLLTSTTRCSLLIEENTNPQTKLDSRVFLLLDLRAFL